MGLLTALARAMPETIRPWRATILVEQADLLPATLPYRRAALVGTEQHLKWIAFECPCGSHPIMLNLSDNSPRGWKVLRADRLTVSPSVDSRHPGGRCHFWIKKGKIIWVRDTGGEHHG